MLGNKSRVYLFIYLVGWSCGRELLCLLSKVPLIVIFFKTQYYGNVQIYMRRTRRVWRTRECTFLTRLQRLSTRGPSHLICIRTYWPPLLFQSKCQTHFVHGAYFLIGMSDICPYFISCSIIFSSPLDPLTISIRKAYFQLIKSCSITFIFYYFLTILGISPMSEVTFSYCCVKGDL